MADAELRSLERQWRATGRVEDEARLLDARRRTGELRLERLELAAWLGHPAARAALGDDAPAGEPAPWSRWANALDRAGVEVLLGRVIASAERTALTAAGSLARDTVSAWLSGRSDPQPDGIDQDLRAGERAAQDAGAFAEAGALAELRLACASVRELAIGEPGSVAGALLRRIGWRETGRPGPALLVAWALGEQHGDATLVPPGVDAAARWLKNRCARDELPRGRLMLAAWSGDPAARAALEDRAPDAPEDDRLWLEGVVRLDPDLAARLVIGLLVSADLLFGDVVVGTAWWGVEESQELAERWLRAPATTQLEATLAELRRRTPREPEPQGRRALEACAAALESADDPRRAPAAGAALLRFAQHATAKRLRRRMRAEATRAALAPGEAPPEEAE